jgi:hypothetical protein
MTKRLLIVCALFLVALSATAGDAPKLSPEFTLSYAASSLEPGKRFSFTVTAYFGLIDMTRAATKTDGKTTWRYVTPDTIVNRVAAPETLRWSFTVPESGKIAEQTFRFTFPHVVAALPGQNMILLIDIEKEFEGVDTKGNPTIYHRRQSLPIRLTEAGPDPEKRCLKVDGLPGRGFGISLLSSCAESFVP